MGSKFYTQEQLEEAKLTLENLPDLTPNKISRSELLDSLKENIITLSSAKGYSAAEIKSALQTVGVTVSEKSIMEIIREAKTPARKKKKTAIKTEPQQAQ